MCAISMKYQPGSNIIIVYCISHLACTHACTHVHTRTPTHHRRRPGCRCSMGRCAPNHDEVNAPYSSVPLAMNGRSVLHSNKQSHWRLGIHDSFGCFSPIKNVYAELRREMTMTELVCARSVGDIALNPSLRKNKRE